MYNFFNKSFQRISDKLPAIEMNKMGQAVELSLFSSVLYSQLSAPEPPISPDGLLISRSVSFVGKFIQEGLKDINKEHFSTVHSVRLRRNLLKTLKTFFIKLLQDTFILETCGECVVDQQINRNDKVIK